MPVIDGIHYEQAGAGPGVLLLAGNGARGRTWHLHQVPALVAAGFRVVTYDTRGVPPSATPEVVTMADLVADAATLIGHLGLGPCRIAGSSMGARVAAELSLERPELVDRAVLMATFDRPGAFLTAVTAAERQLGPDLPAAHLAVVRAALNLSPRTLADDRQAQDWLDVFHFPAAAGASPSRQDTGADQDRLAAYAGVPVPCLVLGFADDLIAPAAAGRRVAAAIPRARYAEIPDAGHYGYLEQPARVNAELITFFQETA